MPEVENEDPPTKRKKEDMVNTNAALSSTDQSCKPKIEMGTNHILKKRILTANGRETIVS